FFKMSLELQTNANDVLNEDQLRLDSKPKNHSD
ncbi:unnamed protein product, partial [Rotaria magnacalcarata]